MVHSPTLKNDDTRRVLLDSYNLLRGAYGRRYWWPAETPFEVIVGAILTQNTNWSNVEKAISNLRKNRLLTPRALHDVSLKKLAGLIRPSGYYNIKSKRLKSFLDYFFYAYSGKIEDMRRRSLPLLRKELLAVKGIGPETADSIILYALGKPSFVIDAYTRRILNCLGFACGDMSYLQIQSIFTDNLPKNTRLFNEYHALFVEHAKRVCRKRPHCLSCVLSALRRRR